MPTGGCWCFMFHLGQWVCPSNMRAYSGHERATNYGRFLRIGCAERFRSQDRISLLNCILMPASTIWIRLW